LLDLSSPSFPRIAAGASVLPIAPDAPARFAQSDLASTHGARQASLYTVFVAGHDSTAHYGTAKLRDDFTTLDRQS